MPDKNLTLKGKILVMDDEEMIRELASAVLRTLGYEAITASEGAEALELFQEARKANLPFAAVILDLKVAEGMNGKETMEKLLEIDPEVRAIVSSGYFGEPVMAKFEKYGFQGRIPKPYKIEEFQEVLERVLEGE